jgi:hypothetical protein
MTRGRLGISAEVIEGSREAVDCGARNPIAVAERRANVRGRARVGQET